MAYHLVVNDAAGSAEEEAVAAAAEAFRTGGAEAVVHRTADPSDIDAVLDDVGPDDVVVVCGGDGSIHVAVTRARALGLLGEVTFAVVPLGTGNDLAGSLGMPEDPAEAAAAICAGTPRDLDLIVDESDGVCVNALHAGVGVDAAARAAALKERVGDLAYPLGALAAGVAAEGWELAVEVDGDPLRCGEGADPVLLVAVMNAATFGGGTRIAPDARPDDGLLDVVLTTATGAAARAAFAAALASGTHLDRDDVVWARGREVTIHGDRIGYNVDGELDDDGVDTRTLRVEPGAWTVIAPAGAP